VISILDVSEEQARKVQEEQHIDNQTRNQWTLLNSEVCEYFGEYQDTDPGLRVACSAKQLSLVQNQMESSEKLVAALKNLEKDYKKCESKPSCAEKMDKSQKNNADKIRSFIFRYTQLDDAPWSHALPHKEPAVQSSFGN